MQLCHGALFEKMSAEQVTILKKVEAIAETCQQVRTAVMILRLSEKRNSRNI